MKVKVPRIYGITHEEGLFDGREEIWDYREFWQQKIETLKQYHKETKSGEGVVHLHAEFMDILIQRLYETVKFKYQEKCKKEWLNAVCVIALGGYGRSELSPNSDIDLMFLYSQKIHSVELEIFVELFNKEVIYPIWDLKLRIRNTFRIESDVLEEAKRDVRTQNALLDARLICGSKELFNLFKETYDVYMEGEFKGSFIERCLAEKRYRYERNNETVFLQEPDIKTGIGGLRDYQMLFWLSRAKFGIKTLGEIEKKGLLTVKECEQLKDAYNHLLRVRNELHFQSQRSTNLLDLEKQLQVAKGLGYDDEDSFRCVERFMRDYYRSAHNIHSIGQLFDERMVRIAGGSFDSWKRLKRLFLSEKEKNVKRMDGFVLSEHEITYDTEAVFKENPVRLIRVFRYGQQHHVKFSSELKVLIRESLDLITAEFINDLAANRCFTSILQAVGEVYSSLVAMYELGVLGRFIPEFEAISCLVQHEYYHQYTADIHTLNTIHVLDQVFAGKNSETRCYYDSIKHTTRPSLLYLILLLHDIGKANGTKDYSRSGVQLAKPILERFQVSEKQKEQALFVIEHHWQMARFWQRFDASDPQVSQAFAMFLKDTEILNYLYVATYCDSKGTAPGLWNSYKEMMHRKLFEKTMEVFSSKDGAVEDRIVRKRVVCAELIRKRYPNFSNEQVTEAIDANPDRYYVFSSPQEMELHLGMIEELNEHISKASCSGSLMPVIHWENDIDQGLTVVTIVTWDRTGLFFNLAGAFSASGLNIVNTKAFTRKDKVTIDTFYVMEAENICNNADYLKGVFNKNLRAILINDEDPMPAIQIQMKKKNKAASPMNFAHTYSRASSIGPSINVYYEHSIRRTIVEVQCNDGIGLLYIIAKVITEHGFDITFAKVATEHGMAVDTLHIQKNNTDEKISTNDLIALREHLNEALDM